MMQPLQQKLTSEIFVLTALIQQEHPELYLLLSETPMFLSYKEQEVMVIDLERYCESLSRQFAVFQKAASYRNLREWD